MTGNASDYAQLEDLLSRSGSPLQLAELHGGLCGVICADGRDAALAWTDSLLDDCSSGDSELLGAFDRELRTLAERTWHALNGLTLEFEPLLPDEDTAIAQRVEALALWCHGFLAGLVIGGCDIEESQAQLPPELAELIRDFAEISRAGLGQADEEQGELADDSLTELIEYVRVGAQLVFEEIGPGPDATTERTIH